MALYEDCPFRFSAEEENLETKLQRSIDINGYAIAENFISSERAIELNKEVTRLLDTVPHGRNPFEGFNTRRLYNIFGKTRAFDDLATNELLLNLVEHCLGHSEFLLSAPTGIEIGPGEEDQLPHRDDGIYPLSGPHHELVVNTMWALDDFTSNNGATVLYPKTHLKTREEQNELLTRVSRRKPLKEGEKFIATMPLGSVLFYRGSVLHGGGANTSGHKRLGVILHYCAGWLRPQENHCLAVPREVVATLPLRLMELLGYSVAKPFVGFVDGRDPKNYFFNLDKHLKTPNSQL